LPGCRVATLPQTLIWTYSTGAKDSFSLFLHTSLKEKANLGTKLWINLITWSNKAPSPESLPDAEHQAGSKTELLYLLLMLKDRNHWRAVFSQILDLHKHFIFVLHTALHSAVC